MICPAGDQCNDASLCTAGICGALRPKPDATACEDGNPATTGDYCLQGVCITIGD